MAEYSRFRLRLDRRVYQLSNFPAPACIYGVTLQLLYTVWTATPPAWATRAPLDHSSGYVPLRQGIRPLGHHALYPLGHRRCSVRQLTHTCESMTNLVEFQSLVADHRSLSAACAPAGQMRGF